MHYINLCRHWNWHCLHCCNT